MRRSAFTAAKACLALGCLSATALLLAPRPQASPRFLAALEANRAAREAGPLVAEQKPTRLRDLFKFKSAHPSDARTAGATGGSSASASVARRSTPGDDPPEPPADRLASTDAAAAPLAGLDRPPTPPLAPAETTVSFRVADAVPPESLVPEPTPEPIPAPAPALADEVRELRAEVLRLAQAQSPPAGGTTVDVSAEVRRVIDEVRGAERLRLLEDEVRRLRGEPVAPADPSQTTTQPAAPVTAAARASTGPAAAVRALPSTAGEDRFNLQVENADVMQVLDLIGQIAGWNVVAGSDVSGSVTLNLRDVSLEEALDAVLLPRDLVAERRDGLLFVFSKAAAVTRAAAARVVMTKVYRPNYMAVKDLQALVTPILTPQIGRSSVTSPSAVGLQLQATTAGGDSLSQRDALVVQDYPEILKQVDEVVAEMDLPPMQVVIEAYILRVRLDDTMKFGVNFALLDDNGKQLVSSGSGSQLATSVGFPTERNRLVPPLAQFVAPAAGLRYGFLSGNVTGFIEALEGIAETSLVASPSLRVLNKQKAELVIGQRLGYKTQTFNNQQTIENVQFLDVGTKLILRPFAAPDGLVRMEIHPERSSGVIDAQGVPQVDTTEVTTNVMVRDGSTVVIGGLIDETTQENLSQVPVLGSIPVIGNAFRNTTEQLVRTELIVLITPRVVCDPVEETRGDVIRTEAERRAATFANRLTPLSRTNLARMHTQRAAELFEKGRLYEAHDHAREALAIRKNDGDAVKLRDRIEQAMRARRRQFFGFPAPGDAAPPQTLPDVPPAPADPIGPTGLPPMPGPVLPGPDPLLPSAQSSPPGRTLTGSTVPRPGFAPPAAPPAEPATTDPQPAAIPAAPAAQSAAVPSTPDAESTVAMPPAPAPAAPAPTPRN